MTSEAEAILLKLKTPAFSNYLWSFSNLSLGEVEIDSLSTLYHLAYKVVSYFTTSSLKFHSLSKVLEVNQPTNVYPSLVGSLGL